MIGRPIIITFRSGDANRSSTVITSTAAWTIRSGDIGRRRSSSGSRSLRRGRTGSATLTLVVTGWMIHFGRTLCRILFHDGIQRKYFRFTTTTTIGHW